MVRSVSNKITITHKTWKYHIKKHHLHSVFKFHYFRIFGISWYDFANFDPTRPKNHRIPASQQIGEEIMKCKEKENKQTKRQTKKRNKVEKLYADLFWAMTEYMKINNNLLIKMDQPPCIVFSFLLIFNGLKRDILS